MPDATVSALRRYPVTSMLSEDLTAVNLTANGGGHFCVPTTAEIRRSGCGTLDTAASYASESS